MRVSRYPLRPPPPQLPPLKGNSVNIATLLGALLFLSSCPDGFAEPRISSDARIGVDIRWSSFGFDFGKPSGWQAYSWVVAEFGKTRGWETQAKGNRDALAARVFPDGSGLQE